MPFADLESIPSVIALPNTAHVAGFLENSHLSVACTKKRAQKREQLSFFDTPKWVHIGQIRCIKPILVVFAIIPACLSWAAACSPATPAPMTAKV